MPKVLLVEDDQNLREIFEMRLQAEGYQTLTAGDGEEALQVALKDKPDLIIADVMMPKLSGFEMLETMRAAPELTGTKVIMMTALGQAEDRARGQKLGVLKYLVKSQVTLEDFVRVVRDVLQPDQAAAAPAAAAATNQAPAGAQANNNQAGGNPMQDDQAPSNQGGSMPSEPSMGTPPADSGMGGTSGQMGTEEEKDKMNEEANKAMGDGSGDMPGGDKPDEPMSPPAGPSMPSEPQAPGGTPPAGPSGM